MNARLNMFEMIKIMQRCLVDQYGIYGYCLSSPIDEKSRAYVNYKTGVGFDIFVDAQTHIKPAKDVSEMDSDELFQYSLILPACIDLKRLGAIQGAMRKHKIIPNSVTYIPETFYVLIELDKDVPDYMLSDDEFYNKYFPGKVWRE